MKKLWLLLITLALFMLVFTLSNKIDFYQNDDWVYYEMVSRFMKGDFTLHPYTGPTFYTQGLIAAGFAKIFSLEKLPILTLLFSVANFYLLSAFILYRMKKQFSTSVLVGLIYFFNPLNMYLTFGFMTEVYFMFFFLLSLWCILLFDETKNYKYLALMALVVFAGLNVRQVSLFIPLGLGLFYSYKQNWKPAAVSLITFGALYFYYEKIFPLTPRIIEVPLQWKNLLDKDYVAAVFIGTFIVLTAFLLHVFLSSVNIKEILSKKKHVLLFLALAVGLYFLMISNFNPHEVSWGEFPYFENTFERTGFYPRGISGTKYYFKGNYDLYRYWDLVSKILFPIFVSYVIVFKRKAINLYLVLAVVYTGMLIATKAFYDRYLHILIPTILLFLLKDYFQESKYSKVILSGFVLFLMFFSYQLSNDFVLVNKYVWNRSEEISKTEGIEEKYIKGTNAWKLNYRNVPRDYLYNFSYDSQKVNEEYACCDTLIEEKTINFPGSIFVDPKIYLYRLGEY